MKCDEVTPACTQCKTTGRLCPGPITGIIFRDMTLTAKRTTSKTLGNPLHRVGRSKRNMKVQTRPVWRPGSFVEIDDPRPDPLGYENSLESRTQNFKFTQPVKIMIAVEPKRDTHLSVEKLGAGIDPFKTLPVGSYFSIPKLVDHCK